MPKSSRLDPRFDWVGPPDPVGKIRPLKLRIVENETEYERKYRERREAINKWNMAFWREHNELFDREKAAFVERKRAEKGDLDQLTADEMSIFYKDFLNSRRTTLADYNWEWYRHNFSLVWPAVRVNFIRFRRLLLRR
uniref:Apoptogenic protein 1, mitochondrial n=1 Tax=Plectus sambesii TaxID=2011161 RepID=A0A914WCR8_9BILA